DAATRTGRDRSCAPLPRVRRCRTHHTLRAICPPADRSQLEIIAHSLCFQLCCAQRRDKIVNRSYKYTTRQDHPDCWRTSRRAGRRTESHNPNFDYGYRRRPSGMKKRFKFGLVLSIVLAVFSIFAFTALSSTASRDKSAPPVSGDAKATFDDKCASCHGKDGRANTMR